MVNVGIVTDRPRSSELRIRSLLRDRGIECEIVSVEHRVIDREFRDARKFDLVLNRVYDICKALVVASLLDDLDITCVNPLSTFLKTFNRVHMYSVLRRNNVDTPPYYLVFDICGVDEVAPYVRGSTYLMTASNVGLDGIVTSSEGLVSIIEHRYYMSDKLAKINIFVPNVESIEDCYVVYEHVVCPDGAEPVRRASKALDCVVCQFKLCRVGGRICVLDVNPVPELSNDLVNKLVERVASIVRR